MPPSDDDYRAEALGALIALVAQLDRAPHRTAALATARNIRALLARSDQVLKVPGATDELHQMADAARARVIKSYGTSAWEEPETVEEAKARMGTLPAAPGSEALTSEPSGDAENAFSHVKRQPEPSPLTDEGLGEVEAALHWKAAEGGDLEPPIVSAKLALNLVAEVRRLRADEWLLRAVDDIGALDTLEGHVDMAKALAILRKHRDGKA
jgi:hypothetical protein